MMLKHKQLIEHDPDNGDHGDCFRAAIACLLDLHPSKVPHVFDGRATTREAMANMRTWLALHHGLTLIEIPFDFDLDDILAWMKHHGQGLHYILTGTSGLGCGHVVVCRDGEIIWDPSSRSTGITGRIEGYLWVGFLAKIL